jgi:hypothetical protein
MPRIIAVLATAAAAVSIAAPATANAAQKPPTDYYVECAQTVANAAPGFATYVVSYTVNNGQPPRIMGPFLPC